MEIANAVSTRMASVLAYITIEITLKLDSCLNI